LKGEEARESGPVRRNGIESRVEASAVSIARSSNSRSDVIRESRRSSDENVLGEGVDFSRVVPLKIASDDDRIVEGIGEEISNRDSVGSIEVILDGDSSLDVSVIQSEVV